MPEARSVQDARTLVVKFRFLERLLVVHGYWCYKRIAHKILNPPLSYFLCGISLLSNVGFPLLAPPFWLIIYKKEVSKAKRSLGEVVMEPKLFIYGAALGLFGGLISLMYAIGMSSLPVSTLSLLTSTQLAFTAFFSFLIVKQKLRFYSINAVALMILGALVLALHTSGDRPEGVSRGRYLQGFFMAIGVAASGGLSTPLVELCYLRNRRTGPDNYAVVLQFQFVMNAFSALFSTCGVIASKEILGIRREAKEYGLGEMNYYIIVVVYATLAQFNSIGFMGILYCTSSLFLGIFTVILLPITQIIAAITFHEKYTAEKGMSLVLCLWGFTSYFVGMRARKTCNTNKTVPPITVQADEDEAATESGTPHFIANPRLNP
ncbi:hypothetical protein Sjap_018829 [Stephania japonica]|uniref:Probable purine permease n=1 Tax=Stephania japonica TaxID=461633 RepID=A0AAP0NLJ4_9MAGN